MLLKQKYSISEAAQIISKHIDEPFSPNDVLQLCEEGQLDPAFLWRHPDIVSPPFIGFFHPRLVHSLMLGFRTGDKRLVDDYNQKARELEYNPRPAPPPQHLYILRHHLQKFLGLSPTSRQQKKKLKKSDEAAESIYHHYGLYQRCHHQSPSKRQLFNFMRDSNERGISIEHCDRDELEIEGKVISFDSFRHRFKNYFG